MPWVNVVRVSPTVYFESQVYREVFPALHHEYQKFDVIGVATYKSVKFVSIEKLTAYVELAHRAQYDVVPLYTSGEYLLQQAVRGHDAQFKRVWDATLHTLGYDEQSIRALDKVEVFLRNSYLITPAWFDKLVQFMNQSIAIADAASAEKPSATTTNTAASSTNSVVDKDGSSSTSSTLGQLLRGDAHYREGKPEVSRTVFGDDHYQWHPFVFERLPVFFLHHSGARVFTALRQAQLFENGDEPVDLLYKGL